MVTWQQSRDELSHLLCRNNGRMNVCIITAVGSTTSYDECVRCQTRAVFQRLDCCAAYHLRAYIREYSISRLQCPRSLLTRPRSVPATASAAAIYYAQRRKNNAYTHTQSVVNQYRTTSILRNDNISLWRNFLYFVRILTFWHGHRSCEVLFDHVLQQPQLIPCEMSINNVSNRRPNA